MRAHVVGLGAVGARAARQLLSLGPLDLLAVSDTDPAKTEAAVNTLGGPATAVHTAAGAAALHPDLAPGDMVILAQPGTHRPLAEVALARGCHVVSTADGIPEVRSLLALDAEARERGLHAVVGAGFSPGLSCVLAAFGARWFEAVEEVHVAKVGTGGPACAVQHHQALGDQALDWRNGDWDRRRGASGRELCFFPDPVGGVDCYRAALPEAVLLVPAFDGVARVTARMGASRRDRLTAGLPMLRKPHPEGELGAVRVEVRGRQGTALDDRVLGAVDRPAVAAGTVAALAALWAHEGRLHRTGAAGLAVLADPGPFLAALAERGVKVAIFEGNGGPSGGSRPASAHQA